MSETDFTINDITTLAILVELNGNCHQVLLSKEDKNVVLHLLSSMSNGLKLSPELVPVELIKKK